jgi:prevent-host-death family protein
VSAASSRGIARLVADAANGDEVVITRHHRPVAAVVGVERLRELDELTADLRDLSLVIARVADDDGHRATLDDVLTAFG